MAMVLSGLGVLCYLAGIVCGFIVLIDAFKNEWWKGLLYMFCFVYGLYYMFVEFQHEKKVQILLTGFLAPAVGAGLFFAGASMASGR